MHLPLAEISLEWIVFNFGKSIRLKASDQLQWFVLIILENNHLAIDI